MTIVVGCLHRFHAIIRRFCRIYIYIYLCFSFLPPYLLFFLLINPFTYLLSSYIYIYIVVITQNLCRQSNHDNRVTIGNNYIDENNVYYLYHHMIIVVRLPTYISCNYL